MVGCKIVVWDKMNLFINFQLWKIETSQQFDWRLVKIDDTLKKCHHQQQR